MQFVFIVCHQKILFYIHLYDVFYVHGITHERHICYI